jgi:hypothetical protein
MASIINNKVNIPKTILNPYLGRRFSQKLKGNVRMIPIMEVNPI